MQLSPPSLFAVIAITQALIAMDEEIGAEMFLR